jgi:hypothetical protein
MDRITYSITYDLATEESTEQGDYAERGYLVNGQELPLPADFFGEAAKRWCEEQGVDVEIDVEGSGWFEDGDIYALERCCAEIVREHYCTEASSSRPRTAHDWFCWYDDSWSAETEDGTVATRSGGVHFDGLTDEQMRRVAWLVFKASHIGESIPFNLV